MGGHFMLSSFLVAQKGSLLAPFLFVSSHHERLRANPEQWRWDRFIYNFSIPVPRKGEGSMCASVTVTLEVRHGGLMCFSKL